MEIRLVAEGDSEEADLVWLQSFERGALGVLRDLREGRERYGDRVVRYGFWDDAGMQAVFQMFDNRLYIAPGVIAPTGYISSIACRPAARGRGYGAAGLAHLLGHMRDAGQILATLTPANYDYYRKLGWDWVGVTRTYRAPSRILPKAPETEYVREGSAADFAGIEAMYARFAAGYRGMSVRSPEEWKTILDGSRDRVSYTYVFERGDGVEGYLVLCGGNGEETSLAEFLTVSPVAQRGLLGLLHRLQMQTKIFTWDAPGDDGLWSHFLHREIQTALQPSMQARVVDVRTALQALRPPTALRGAIVVGISDDLAPWNTGSWRVEVEGGAVTVEKNDGAPELQADVQAFTQAFLGALSPAALRDGNRVEVGDERAFRLFGDLLDGPSAWASGPI